MEGAEVLGDAGIEPVTSLSCSTVLLLCPRQRPRASQRRSSFIHSVIRVSSPPARRHSRAVCLTGGCSSSPRNPPSRIPATSASRSAWPPASPRSSVTPAVGLARVIWRGAVPAPLGSRSGGFDKGRWPVRLLADRAGFSPAPVSPMWAIARFPCQIRRGPELFVTIAARSHPPFRASRPALAPP